MEEEIDLIELLNMVWKKKGIIIIVTIIFGLIGALYSLQYKVPKYKSSTTLLLAQNDVSGNNEMTNEITQTDITLNQKLVSTYGVLVKSKTVLSQVLENLNMTSMKEEELKQDISVSAVEDTQVIEITYTNKDARVAYLVANELSTVFCNKVAEIYNINNVYIIDKAELADEPYNMNVVKDILVFIVIGILISCIIIFIISLLDTTVKTPEDIERNTRLVVLAQIPEIKSGRKK